MSKAYDLPQIISEFELFRSWGISREDAIIRAGFPNQETARRIFKRYGLMDYFVSSVQEPPEPPHWWDTYNYRGHTRDRLVRAHRRRVMS